MEKRVVIKFYTKLGKSASETYRLMKEVYGDCCINRSNGFVWHKRFLGVSDMVEDDQYSGRPISSRTSEIIKKVRNFLRFGKRLLCVIKNDGRLFKL
ncbi:uncharacterized protein TNCV_4708451 [Trichonephila clavipes]|nr:uncharacterized protein TNCV_4708451 [Trichonephila clavipes]